MFAELVRAVSRPHECRHCGTTHKGGRLCMRAQEERMREKWFRRRFM